MTHMIRNTSDNECVYCGQQLIVIYFASVRCACFLGQAKAWADALEKRIKLQPVFNRIERMIQDEAIRKD